MFDLLFYQDKKVLITGHTGFKGTWMCKVLVMFGAKVTGYALEPPASSSIFEQSGVATKITSIIGDIRDLKHLKKVFDEVQPEIVIHMAAQPLVRESYENPVYTYETNVLGTVNVLECIRLTKSVRSCINVTTDKVYLNKEWEWGYREVDELNGYDPYSNSKSCSELVTSSYIKSFFQMKTVGITTVRAGNVIGGGDFAENRIIPDCIRAVEKGRDIEVRNPYSIRPYQHVLDPVMAYLMIAKEQYENIEYAGNYNIGPDEDNCLTTGELVTLFCKKWNEKFGTSISWINTHDGGPHEAQFLKLDCSKIKRVFGWNVRWNITEAIEKVIEWTSVYLEHKDIAKCMDQQIKEFLSI